jgi:hypothetical protein
MKQLILAAIAVLSLGIGSGLLSRLRMRHHRTLTWARAYHRVELHVSCA